MAPAGAQVVDYVCKPTPYFNVGGSFFRIDYDAKQIAFGDQPRSYQRTGDVLTFWLKSESWSAKGTFNVQTLRLRLETQFVGPSLFDISDEECSVRPPG